MSRSRKRARAVAAGMILVACLGLGGSSATSPGPAPSEAGPTAHQGLGAPAGYEVNQGQADPSVAFLSRGGTYPVYLSTSEAVFQLPGEGPPLRLQVVGHRHDSYIEGVERMPGVVNDLRGNDPSRWLRSIPTYRSVVQRAVLPGVDMLFHGAAGDDLEYDLVLAPHADPATVEVRFDGAHDLSVDGAGALVLHTRAGAVRQRAPILYQDVDGARRAVAGRYRIFADHRVGFDVGPYDPGRVLVIDPTITFRFQVPGGVTAAGVAVDSSGHVYVTGSLPSVPPGYARVGSGGGKDAFIAKLNPSGTALEYATILGGGASAGSPDDTSNAITVDASGRAHVAGTTNSDDFPVTSGAFQPHRACAGASSGRPCSDDAFFAVLDPTGANLVYSTYFGGAPGEDEGRAIALDSSGMAYVGGETQQHPFPTTPGAFRTQTAHFMAGFVAKFDPSASGASSRVYATLLTELPSGQLQSGTFLQAIAVDSAGSAYVTGSAGQGFPLTAGAFDHSDSPSNQATRVFVTKFNADGTDIAYSTRLGTNFGWGYGIAVDSGGSAYVTGRAGNPSSSSNTTTGFPIAGVPSSVQPRAGGRTDAFVTRINPTGSVLTYSTYLGGGMDDVGNAIAVDSGGNAFVAGATASTNFPEVTPVTGQNGATGAFVTKVNAAGSALTYSTRLAGADAVSIGVDPPGAAYLAQSDGAVVRIGTRPVVSSASPLSGPSAGGIDLTITGTGFTGATAVAFGSDLPISCAAGSACRPDLQHPDTTLRVTTPAHPPGRGAITVTTAEGMSTVDASTPVFTWNPPVVSSISPALGPATGETAVTLTGSDLQGSVVSFGPNLATTLSVDPTGSSVTVTLPPSPSAGPVPAALSVPAAGATAAATPTFTYVPAITGILPGSGKVEGGDQALIVGEGFNGATGATFGADAVGQFVVASHSQIVVVTPPHPLPEPVPVVVTDHGLDSVAVPLGANMFSYGVSAPSGDTGISPTGAPPTSHTSPGGPTGFAGGTGGGGLAGGPQPSGLAVPSPGAAPAPGAVPGGFGSTPAPPSAASLHAPAPLAGPAPTPGAGPGPGAVVGPPPPAPTAGGVAPAQSAPAAPSSDSRPDHETAPRYSMVVGAAAAALVASFGCVIVADRRRPRTTRARAAWAGLPTGPRLIRSALESSAGDGPTGEVAVAVVTRPPRPDGAPTASPRRGVPVMGLRGARNLLAVEAPRHARRGEDTNH